MPIFALTLPDFKRKKEERPLNVSLLWGKDFPMVGTGEPAEERYTDHAGESVSISLLDCKHSFRHYPEGVNPA